MQDDKVWLAKAALASGQPKTALELLTGQPVLTDWFAEQISFRVGYTARRLVALAGAMLSTTPESPTDLRLSLDRLERFPLLDGLDPLAAELRRSLGEIDMLHGRFGDAVVVLDALAADEGSGRLTPPQGWTLVLLARAADGIGDRRLVRECYESVARFTTTGVDPVHPVLLTAHLDEAIRRARETDIGGAAGLLAPLLSGQVSGGPEVLEAGHPLLVSARALARRLGVLRGPQTAPPHRDMPPLDTGI